ncbi:polymorphic toxin-type HINT domain-containing protein [Streptomyces canus]|uniref:polymorphic toxin-type HINT domain-containing protein n=1 Tax=Streptomyces canus TaxID=58343 RepID=UPI00386EE246|nr:polymorphic toxin-type HINT domain-containing protein [Streptomyces canus]
MGGYTYAGDNPVSSSDPSGLCDRCDGEGPGGQAKPKKHHHSAHGGSTSTSSGNTSASPAPSTTPTPSLGPAPSSTQTPTPTLGEVPCQPADFGTNRWGSYGGGKLFLATVGTAVAAGAVMVCVDTGLVDCVAGLAMGVADAEAGGSLLAGSRVIVGLGNAAAETIEEADELAAEASAAKQATEDAAAARGAAANKADAQAQAEHANTEAAAPDTPSKGESTSTAKEGCSFSPDTPVLMDNGKTTPIGKIKTGDKVEAANPRAGKHQGARTVQHVWINHDHDLLDLTVRTKDGHTAILHTTANHPFWDDTTHTWVAAGNLHHGDALNTAANGHAYVVKTQPTPGAANRWNLTVQQLHTYYVLAGNVPILVHNTNTGCPTSYALSLKTGAPKGSGANQAYQVRVVGSTEYHATGGGTQVWADSLDINTSELLDAKYVGNAGRSPFVPGGKVPDFIQAKIDTKMNDEFSRYAAVINDPGNPLVGLRVITNEPPCHTSRISCSSTASPAPLSWIRRKGAGQ